MELTRRDVVAALGAAGVAAGAGSVAFGLVGDGDRDDADVPLSTGEMDALVAATEALYPADVENVPAFVTAYVRGRADDRPAHVEGIAEAVGVLEEYARSWHDVGFADLDLATREAAFEDMGADTADPVPDGAEVERVRYYVCNELLFALYSTPTGAELVGLENPQGHPGGLGSYQRGPES